MDDTKANPDNVNGRKDKGEMPEGVEDIYMLINNKDQIFSIEFYEDGTVNEVTYDIEDFDEYISFEYEGEDAPNDAEYHIMKEDDILLVSIWSGKKALSHFMIYEESGKEYADLFPGQSNNEVSVDASNNASQDMTTYGEGLYLIGTDIPSGEYKFYVDGDNSGYFKITDDRLGYSDIIANSLFYDFSYAIMPEGKYISIGDCYAVPVSEAIPYDAMDNGGKYFEESVYKVGFDMPAGEYKLTSNDDDIIGMYQIYSKSDYSSLTLIAIDLVEEEIFITLHEGEYFSFSSSDAVSTGDSTQTQTQTSSTDSSYTFVADSSHGMEYKIPSEFDKQNSDDDFVYYYFDDYIGFIMVQPYSDFKTNVLSDVLWASFVSGLAETDGYTPRTSDIYLTVDGVDARIHNFVLEIAGYEYTAATAGFIKNDLFYTMSIIADNSIYDDYYPVFIEVLESVEVQ